MTPGMKSSEFKLTIALTVGAVAAAAANALSPRYAAIASAISVAAYSIGRGLAKKQVPTAVQ